MKTTKTLKVVTTAALVASLATPFTAFAATYSGTNVTGVTAGSDSTQNLGKAYVEFGGSELTSGDYLLVSLPSDFNLGFTVGDTGKVTGGFVSDTGKTVGATTIERAAGANYLATDYVSNGNIRYQVVSKNQIRLNFAKNNVNNLEGTGKFYINFQGVKVPSGAPSEIKATLEGKQGSAFNDGSVTVATASTSGSVTTTIDKAKTITSGGNQDLDNIRIKEDRVGSFKVGDTLKYKLPSGFKWTSSNVADLPTSAATIPVANIDELNTGGVKIDQVKYFVSQDGRQLNIVHDANDANTYSEAAYLLLKGFRVAISDETVAKNGDVVAAVSTSGNVSTSNSDLLVAKYGDYGTKIYTVGDPKDVQAGMIDQKIGAFAIEESVKESLQAGRTINLTLSGNAKWGSRSDFRYDDGQSKNKNTNVIDPNNNQIIGSDNKTLRLTVKDKSSDALKAVLKDARINVSPEATGDIKLTVSGSAGLTGELTVAKVVKPVTVKVDGALPNIQIGQQAQPIGDITLTEAAKEAIDHTTGHTIVSLIFPEGVTPTLPTSVQVADGDLSIDTGSAQKFWHNNRWEIQVTTRSTSTKPSTLKFSGIKVTVDRTVPEGPIAVKVGGDALVQTAVDFPGVDSVTSVDVANVGTPAAGKGSSAYVAFKLGATTYTVDGVEKTMDVAPFAENSRTFLPIRFAADALGAQNVQWDQATKTVTVFKNGNIVQMVLGKKEYKLNGVAVPMDVTVQAKKGRVVLPIRFLGDALNVPVNYNETTGEIALGTPAVK